MEEWLVVLWGFLYRLWNGLEAIPFIGLIIEALLGYLYFNNPPENLYDWKQRKIYITTKKKSKTEAFSSLLTELYYFYQYEFNSKTIEHEALREGSERAAKIKIMEKLSNLDKNIYINGIFYNSIIKLFS